MFLKPVDTEKALQSMGKDGVKVAGKGKAEKMTSLSLLSLRRENGFIQQREVFQGQAPWCYACSSTAQQAEAG